MSVELQRPSSLFGSEIDPDDEIFYDLLNERGGRKSSLSYQLSSGNINRMFTLSEQLQALTVSANQNQIEPDVSVFLTNTLSSSDSSFMDSLGQVGRDLSIQAGVSVSLPLENTLAISNYKTALLTYNALLKSNENNRLVLADNITILYQQLESLSALIVHANELEKLANETAVIEQEKHRQGRTASLFLVLDTQNKALSAQLQVKELQFQKMHIENQLAGLNDDYLSYIKPFIKDSYVK